MKRVKFMKNFKSKKAMLAAAFLIGTMSFGYAGNQFADAATPAKVLA